MSSHGSQYTSASLKMYFFLCLPSPYITDTSLAVYNTTTGTNQYDTYIHLSGSYCTVYNIMQSENTTGLLSSVSFMLYAYTNYT